MPHIVNPHPVPDPDWQRIALFIALELSGKSWLVATCAPGDVKVSKRTLTAGDGKGLLALLDNLRGKAERRTGHPVPLVTIHEAGLDGFWLQRLLSANGIHSHVGLEIFCCQRSKFSAPSTDILCVDQDIHVTCLP
jgi:hypothetical protein